MWMLLFIIVAILLFGAAAIRSLLLAVVGVVAGAGTCAYLSISAGWPAWVTLVTVFGAPAGSMLIPYAIMQMRNNSDAKKRAADYEKQKREMNKMFDDVRDSMANKHR